MFCLKGRFLTRRDNDMKRNVKDWTVKQICENRNNITFPDYQREPHLWSDRDKIDLIDSIKRGLDIPKLYFYYDKKEKQYEVVDGQQRL